MITENATDVRSWPDLAIGLYDKLTGRGAEISYEFRNMEISVPDKVGHSVEHTLWKLNGVLVIRTTDSKAAENSGNR